MSEIPVFKRSMILQYRLVDKFTYPEIATRIDGVSADSARKFCDRTQQRAKSTDITKLLAEVNPLPRSGRPRRVEPGSDASTRIRAHVRGVGRFQKQTEAVNNNLHVIRDNRITTQRRVLGELKAQQVHNICQGPHHSAADPIDSRPITRNEAWRSQLLLSSILTSGRSTLSIYSLLMMTQS